MISPQTLAKIIFDEDVTAIDLLHLVFALAIFWAVAFRLATAAIQTLVVGKPWLKAAAERDYDHGVDEVYDKFGRLISREKFILHFTNMWSWRVTVALQHFIGGALCIPAVLKIGDSAVASSLACLGIMSEMGWELQDTISWIYKSFFSKKEAIPTDGMLATVIMHHTLTIILGIPTVLYYRNLDILHMLTFELQTIAGLVMVVAQYSKLLDVTKKRQLNQLRVLTFLICVAMIFTRGFRWSYLCAKLILVWYNDKGWGFLTVGSIVIFIFSLFNYFFCIERFYKRLVKIMDISTERCVLPDNIKEGR